MIDCELNINNICGLKFIDDQEYINHLGDTSDDIFFNSDFSNDLQSSLKVDKELYKCSKCDSVFDKASLLEYHTKNIHQEKSQICQICMKGFFQNTDSQTHLNTNDDTDQSECQMCGKNFNHNPNVIKHFKSHSGLKPYSCYICGKTFTQISSLTKHKNIHLKSSNDSDSLIQIKEKTKRHCKVCNESFQFIKLLREHEKIHEIKLNPEDFLSQTSDHGKLLFDETDDKMGSLSLESDVFSSLNLSSGEIQLKSSDLEQKIMIDDEVEENICDILNFCNPDELQIDLMQKDSNDEVIKKFFNFDTFLNKETQNKSLQVEGNQTYIEICKSDNLKPLELHSIGLDDLNISLLPGSVNNMEKNLAVKSVSEALLTEEKIETPTVRLVQNEEGEQFFELVRDTIDFVDERVAMQPTEQNSAANDSDKSILKGSQSVSNVKKKTPRKKSKTSNEQKKRFECNVCQKTFPKASNLNQHMGIHFSDQQKFQCKFCDKFFAWKSTLNKHLAHSHRIDGVQTFVCEICPKVYNTLSQVNEHVRRDHLKIRNHMCEHCGKSFFRYVDLKSHIRIHTNEKPYICGKCGKSFYYQSHIIRHERIHSGERPYSCDICEKSFTQLKSLKLHKQKHQDLMKIDILDYQIDEDDLFPLNST